MPDVSVIIATLKPRDEIECIPYLERGTFDDYEVIVRNDDRVTTARNEGIRQAKADKLVFLDDDSHPCADYLEHAAEVLEREAAYAGKVVHPRDDIFAKHFTPHYSFGETPRYVTRFWGCNMGIHRDVFDDVGLWDENITWGHEEKELAERVIASYDIYYDPELLVHHCYTDSILNYWKKQYRLERQTPYYWDTQGKTTRWQWLRIAHDVFHPMHYLGWSAKHAIVRSGGNLARTAGRVRGMLVKRHSDATHS